ncbi:MAG TPA: acyl-CoA dehydrogenase [Rubrivivax sp.]|nr:acyl-CoA dehydrogenase [Rubrivivax sp.]
MCRGKLWRLHGRKTLVPAGDHAHAFIVAAQLDGEPALLLPEARAPGVEVGGYPLHDGARAADLLLNAAPAELVARGEAAACLLRAMNDIGLSAQAAEAIGLMDRLLLLVREHLGTRRQFGVTLDSFQALRHRVADMKLQLELARGMSFYAALELVRPSAQRRARVFSQVKVQLGQAARFVGQQAVQLHGGIGVSDESVVGHAFKRLSCMELQFGDTLQHLGQVVERMQDEAGVFAD